MPWAYCHNCDAEMDHPTIADVFAGKQECPRCGTDREVGEHERRWTGEEIADRLEKLEYQVFGPDHGIPFAQSEE